MLTHLTIRNFKRFEFVDIELGSPVVFIGPNNSGKTSAMQALALWDIGLRRWNEKRSGQKAPEKRPGVAVNRRDLVAIPVPDANLLWRARKVRNMRRVDGKQATSNVRIDITVSGVGDSTEWDCGLEFDYANDESFYCRPLRLSETRNPERMPVPTAAGGVQIAFLPPMSGLAATETRLDHGAVNVRVGEGRTAEVLRNLCHRVHEEETCWADLVGRIRDLFGAELRSPRYISERGEIAMSYREHGVQLDLSSAGRGLQQTLLLLAYMYANPGAVLLLDEPDAHLEILRQRQTYRILTDTAEGTGSQIIAASHSEVLLNEASHRDLVIAFVGEPHRLDNRGSQVQKALREFGFEHYYQAEQTGWVLYLEGSTDLSILQAFAARLGHSSALQALERPFVQYVGNQPSAAANHFHAIREALPELLGIALFDNLDQQLPDAPRLCIACGSETRLRTTWQLGARWRDSLPLQFGSTSRGRCSQIPRRPDESARCGSRSKPSEQLSRGLARVRLGIRTSKPATISSIRSLRTTLGGWACPTSCPRRATICWPATFRRTRSAVRL